MISRAEGLAHFLGAACFIRGDKPGKDFFGESNSLCISQKMVV